MKGKRHTTEEKIRMLREVDGGKPIREVCQEKNLSEATYHRWRKQFGLMEVNEAKRMASLERLALIEVRIKNNGKTLQHTLPSLLRCSREWLLDPHLSWHERSFGTRAPKRKAETN